VAGVQSAVSPGSVLSPLLYESRRGFEVESLAGGLTLLAAPSRVKFIFAYSSREIVGPYHTAISLLVTAAMLAGLIAIWRLAAQRRLSLEACSLAVLTVAVLGDKAFSTQYLIWLVPFWAYWPLRRGWLAAAALTTLVYPFLFIEAALVGHGFYPATAASLVRNVVLIVATARWLHDQLRTPEVAARERLENPYHGLVDGTPPVLDAGRYAPEPRAAPLPSGL